MTERRDAPELMTIAVGDALDRIIRVSAMVMVLGLLALLVVAELPSSPARTPPPVRYGMAALLFAVHLTAAFTPWSELTRRPQGQRLLEAYPLVVLLSLAPLPVFVVYSPLFGILMLMMAIVGALYSRRNTVLLLAGVPTVTLLASLVTQDDADPVVTGTLVVAIVLGVWIAATAGRGYRVALHQQFAARLRSEAQQRGLDAVAAAAQRIQVLEPDRVLQAVADVTETLDWTMCGLYVPSPDGKAHVLGGHRGIPPEISRLTQPQVGVFGEVMRTGKPVAFENYGEHPGANPQYAQLGTAVGAPVLVHGVQRGALVVGRVDRVEVTEADVRLIELLADQAGRALEIAEQYERQEATVAELERVNQLKQDFVATVSHELRTPLQVVLGMAETLNRRWDEIADDSRREMMRRLRVNATGLENVIESLLDFSRLEKGVVHPQRKAFGMVEVARTVVERLETLTTNHEVRVEAEGTANDDQTWGDPLLIERVIENLVVNATRHTPKKTTVRVRILGTTDETVVEVTDDGPGIPKVDLARLGERFFRGGDPTTRSSRGLGLGLAFCAEVLLLHESELEIASTAGAGATFRFRLPHAMMTEPATG